MTQTIPAERFRPMTPVLARFLRYVSVPTASDPDSTSSPSTGRQLVLAKMLAGELRELGAKDASLSPNGVVTATIPASEGARSAPVMMLNAHMDTSPEASGEDIRPAIAPHWQGDEIELDPAGKIVLSPSVFPELLRHRGEDIVCTGGRTLLGADDKAGIAAIMQAAEWFLSHPEDPHAEIRLVFTPDEEIGRGTRHVDIPGLKADYGFTVDGGEVGGLESETFNAAEATVSFRGISVHPGSAKGKMVNALKLAAAFVCSLPGEESPEETSGREGFFHPVTLAGSVEKAEVRIILRDHDREKLEEKKRRLLGIAARFSAGGAVAPEVTLRDQYPNMKEFLRGKECILELARQAYAECGVVPREEPVRGGTDGAMFSAAGLPCPNLFTGGLNFHGIYECIPVQSLETAARMVRCLIRRSAAFRLPEGSSPGS